MPFKASWLCFAVAFFSMIWAIVVQVFLGISWLWLFVLIFSLWAIFFAVQETKERSVPKEDDDG